MQRPGEFRAAGRSGEHRVFCVLPVHGDGRGTGDPGVRAGDRGPCVLWVYRAGRKACDRGRREDGREFRILPVHRPDRAGARGRDPEHREFRILLLHGPDRGAGTAGRSGEHRGFRVLPVRGPDRRTGAAGEPDRPGEFRVLRMQRICRGASGAGPDNSAPKRCVWSDGRDHVHHHRGGGYGDQYRVRVEPSVLRDGRSDGSDVHRADGAGSEQQKLRAIRASERPGDSLRAGRSVQ